MKETHNNLGTGIVDCFFPEWYWKSNSSFKNLTRSFFGSDQIRDDSERIATVLSGWGDILNITLNSWMRISQKGLDIGKASLKQGLVDPEPFLDAIDSATREIAESFEAFLKNSSLAPAQDVVEAMKSAMKILEPEASPFRNGLKHIVVFHLKILKITKDGSDRIWKDGWAFNENNQAMEAAVQEVIIAQSELVKGMLEDTQVPEEAKSKHMSSVDGQTEMLGKGLAVLVTGSNLVNQVLRASAESWGELFLSRNGKGDLQKGGFHAIQERYEQVVRKTVQESRLADMLPQWAHTGHELSAAAVQWRNTLMFWSSAAETDSRFPAPVAQKTKGGSAKAPVSAEVLAE